MRAHSGMVDCRQTCNKNTVNLSPQRYRHDHGHGRRHLHHHNVATAVDDDDYY